MGIINISRLARAKINLNLLITGQRDDGYHLLDSLVVFAEYGDQIHVSPADQLELSISGPFAPGLTGRQDNLVLKAARLVQEKFNIPWGAKIELVKNLPVSSGIGGGSADAAATIHAVMELWKLSDKASELGDLPLSLGADVPVCMASETMRMSGIGERLHPVAIRFPLYLLLINPGNSVSTADIFRARAKRKAEFSMPQEIADEIVTLDQLRNILTSGGNDLEYEACVAQPEIKRVLEQIRSFDDCIYASMSGSGATCFGIFSTFEAANRVGDSIFRRYPGWWVQPVQID